MEPPIRGATGVRTSKRSSFGRSFVSELRRNKFLYVLALPMILYFFVFSYLPMFGIVVAFQDYRPIKGIMGSQFVGLKNFDFFFTSQDWLHVTFNTLYLNALFIAAGLLVQVAVAIMIAEIVWKPFKKVAQSITLLPHFISWPIVALFSVSLFSTDSGYINAMLHLIGVPPVNFYQNPDVWPGILVMLRVWKDTGYGVIIYLATIVGIDQEIYESARIDGASRFRCMWHITVPMLKNTTIVLLLLAVGRIFFGDFGMIYTIIGDNALLYSTTDVIDTFVYRALRQYGDISMSSAVGLYQSVVGFVIVLAANWIVRKMNKEAALF